jgi:fluoroacetyl-CoA thioesterase
MVTPGLIPGLTHTVTYQVRSRDLVTTLFPDKPEFARKPAVLATGILVALCEWPAMDALRHIISDDQDSLGTQVHICHRAPVCAGTQLTITAHCASVSGQSSRWDVSVCAGTQPVASGWVQFTVVHTPAFVQRHSLQPTTAATVPSRRHPVDDLSALDDQRLALADAAQGRGPQGTNLRHQLQHR